MVLTGWRDIVAASPELKFRDRRWNRYCSNVVSGLPTTRKPWWETDINIFVLEFSFPKCFYQKFFSKIFSSTFFLKRFLKFFFNTFFSNIFFLISFSKDFFNFSSFEGFTLDASTFLQKQNGLFYVSVMKNMICNKRSTLDFRLLWRVEYSFSAHTAHIPLDVKSPISSPCCINILFCSEVKHDIEEVLLNK